MTFSLAHKVLLGIALVATGYFGAQAMRATLEARQEAPRGLFDEADIAVKAEATKPRFVGDVGGIFIAPEGTPVPERYTTFEDTCGDQWGKNVSWEEAGELDFAIPLPATYAFQPDDINTAVVACGDTVFIARRVYTTASGGEVIIGRTLFDYSDIDVAVDRPTTQRIADRDVVLIEPITESGVFQNAYAYFPETFGKTFVHASNLSRSEFRELVAMVASSTR